MAIAEDFNITLNIQQVVHYNIKGWRTIKHHTLCIMHFS